MVTPRPDKARGEKNKTTEMLTNHLADRFFEKHISSNINIKNYRMI